MRNSPPFAVAGNARAADLLSEAFADIAEEKAVAAADAARRSKLALFDVDGKVLEMKLPAAGMTPCDITSIWEKEWGVPYASRLKFEAPQGSRSRWLSAREDPVPTAPAEVRLSGIGSILRSVRSALVEHGGATGLPPEPPPERREGPRCPGTYIRLPHRALRQAAELDVVMRHLGVGAPGRGAAGRREEGEEEEEEGASKAEAAAARRSATRSPEEQALRLALSLCGFSSEEADDLVDAGRLRDCRSFARMAASPEEARQLARELGLATPKAQALFAEAWRRCALHVAGPRQEYPPAIMDPVCEVDFGGVVLHYLESVRNLMDSEQFEAACANLEAGWRQRPRMPDSEQKMVEVADLCFEMVYSRILAPFGFTPNSRGKKAAQAAVRQAGKQQPEVREMEVELMKANMRRFKI